MIFQSINEAGVPAWQLVLQAKKTVTRRVKPLRVGKVFAVQPGRGKKAVCRARVISCEDDEEWCSRNRSKFDEDARKEGFVSWEALWDWLYAKHGRPRLPKLYRIEFKVLAGG